MPFLVLSKVLRKSPCTSPFPILQGTNFLTCITQFVRTACSHFPKNAPSNSMYPERP